jgi:hypothetical protein
MAWKVQCAYQYSTLEVSNKLQRRKDIKTFLKFSDGKNHLLLQVAFIAKGDGRW